MPREARQLLRVNGAICNFAGAAQKNYACVKDGNPDLFHSSTVSTLLCSFYALFYFSPSGGRERDNGVGRGREGRGRGAYRMTFVVLMLLIGCEKEMRLINVLLRSILVFRLRAPTRVPVHCVTFTRHGHTFARNTGNVEETIIM